MSRDLILKSTYERMVESEDRIAADLEQEYAPVDPALIRAILCDFDFSEPTQLKIVREYLDTLRADAILQEDSLFDPSGTSGLGVLGPSLNNSPANEDILRQPALSVSGETDSTGLSNGFSSLSMHSVSESEESLGSDGVMEDLEKLDTKDKITRLLEMFPKENETHVSFLLRKHDDKFTRTMDELLNHAYFNGSEAQVEERVSARSVDAFAEEHSAPRSRRHKGKNKKFRSLDDQAISSSSKEAGPNKWVSASTDIQFIASRANIASPIISSIYHKNGASRQRTILALIAQNQDAASTSTDDFSADIQAINLSEEFPSLTFERAAALLRLTYPSTASAHELAKAVVTYVNTPQELDRIVPQYVPVNLSDSSSSPQVSPSSRVTFTGNSAQLANDRAAHFMKASQYYRKGKSDHLMGGAAAYYASLGRDANAAMKRATASEADALVAAHSTPTQLDLHGVSVKDATRIASERVRAWWHHSKEGRLGGDRGVSSGHYTIITGVGRHSEGGVAKLGPAVTRMLLREGWKVEVSNGILIVTGVAKN